MSIETGVLVHTEKNLFERNLVQGGETFSQIDKFSRSSYSRVDDTQLQYYNRSVLLLSVRYFKLTSQCENSPVDNFSWIVKFVDEVECTFSRKLHPGLLSVKHIWMNIYKQDLNDIS